VSRAIRLVLEAKSTEAIRILEAQLGSNLEGFERALTLRTLARVNGDESIAAEAQAIFDTLGVVQVRPLPIA